MSRIPQSSRLPQPSTSRPAVSSSTRAPAKPSAVAPSTPVKSRTTPSVTTPRPTSRAQLTSKPAITPSKPPPKNNDEAAPSSHAMSIREAIALKRAEAKKAQTGLPDGGGMDWEAKIPDLPAQAAQDSDDILGRWPLRETIERGRSTGNINISSRSLQCIPSALFEIHLGINPDPLKSVPNEPPLPPTEPAAPRRGGNRESPAWFEQQDLQVLKAWNNEILEIQHEISLFGSLKTIDLHKNKLVSLPESFADLSFLTALDLSHNALTSLPSNLFALPELTTLNLAYNQLTALAFNSPFVNGRSPQQPSSGFFKPSVARAATPLPKLVTLDVAHNKFTASGIDLAFPASLIKFDLSINPLGLTDPKCKDLLQALAKLPRLKELKFENSEIDDSALPPDHFVGFTPFPSLKLLDFAETRITKEAVEKALTGAKQELDFRYVKEDPPGGVMRVFIGRKVLKEAWEIEIEQRNRRRLGLPAESNDVVPSKNIAPREIIKEDWEIEAEQGLLTQGGKRRARAAAAAVTVSTSSADTKPSDKTLPSPSTPSGTTPEGTTAPTTFSLSSPQYYAASTQTLTLPPSAPLKTGHTRAFSMAGPARSTTTSPNDLAIPAPTLPLSVIVTQPLSSTLRQLVLVNRKMDKTFSIPYIPQEGGEAFLPCLEELNLEGCALSDTVNVTIASAGGDTTPARTTEPLLTLLARLFPSLRSLDLSYNNLTSAALTPEALSALILASPNDENKNGLKHLRLKGNRLSELDGFQKIAELFKGNREVLQWKLDELDLRDNEIGKLPSELGLLPLEVFLVDGNTFRVPQRRVWEREGTKGLLAWLRGRIE